MLARLVRSDSKTPLKDVTTKFNENRETQVSKRTVQRSLYQEGYNRRVVKKKVIGELKVSGTELYFQTKVRWSLETIIGLIFGGKRTRPSPEIVFVHLPRDNFRS